MGREEGPRRRKRRRWRKQLIHCCSSPCKPVNFNFLFISFCKCNTAPIFIGNTTVGEKVILKRNASSHLIKQRVATWSLFNATSCIDLFKFIDAS